MSPTTNPRRGLVLGELLLVLVISSVVLVALLSALIALLRGLQPQSVAIGGENLPIAPTFGAFPSAVRLHQVFIDRLSAARAVYVFGGRHLSIPADAPEASLAPLKCTTLPSIAAFTAGLPLDAKTFYDSYASSLGELESLPAPDDFSVAIVGKVEPASAGATSTMAVTALVQSRVRPASISDGSTSTAYVIREVRMWDLESGEFRYAFAERPTQTAGIFNGAVHTWHRYQRGVVAEEGPAAVVFPDPWIYAGSRGRADEVPPFSRFSYFVAVSP